MRKVHLLCVAATLGLGVIATNVFANSPKLQAVNLNQSYIENLSPDTGLNIADPMAVFDAVFATLPARVTVYPTENYFYFNFYYGSTRFAGNIRLDVMDRDKGVVHFAYFKDYAEWSRGGDVVYRKLEATSGVNLQKLADLAYRITYGGKSVDFTLNDLTQVKPEEGFLRKEETYLGPVFDESGVQFFFVFNSELRKFYYFLNEDARHTETYRSSDASRRVLIGDRTGFAFFRDRYRDRKILIGVFESNSNTNSYFDGPFDQLPDNFLKGDELRQAILAIKPDLKGKIDRFGNSPDGAERYYIGPYAPYRDDGDLQVFVDCTMKARRASNYYRCFDAAELSSAN